MSAYYNEIDPYAAQWLRNLIAAGHIASGVVDERSIEDVIPDELREFTQCHFFAGVGVWSLALRNAGWPDDKPVWTGSCPCQPFSAAGQGSGFADERHLWPAFFHLIEQCKPPAIFGEQVASKDANAWIDLVQDDLEGLGYGVGAVAFPSAGVGAPHIRDRLYWMADSGRTRPLPRAHAGIHRGQESAGAWDGKPERHGTTDGLADSASNRRDGKGSAIQTGRNSGPEQSGLMAVGLEGCPLSGISEAPRMAISPVDNANDAGLEGFGSGHQASFGHGQGAVRSASTTGESSGLADTQLQQRSHGQSEVSDEHDTRGRQQSTATLAGLCSDSGPPGPVNGRWSDADWLLCRDGKWRPVEPGTFPLVDGASSRVGRLRAYGNAINAKAAQVFIESYLSA